MRYPPSHCMECWLPAMVFEEIPFHRLASLTSIDFDALRARGAPLQ